MIDNQDDPIITYGDLVEKLPFEYNPRNLDKPLGVISSACLANDLPPISSIVVNKDTQLPGEGFYKQFYLNLNWQKDMQKIFEENKLAITNCTIWKDFLDAIENDKLIKREEISIKRLDKEMMIEKIDNILEQVPPKHVKSEMNHHVEDFIYDATLLQSNLEKGICYNCRENDMSNCDNCDLNLKKDRLNISMKFSNKLWKRNKRRDNLKKSFVFCGKTIVKIIILLVALFGITFDSTVKKLFYDYIPSTSIYLREQELKCLRTDFSREYIESELGKPKSVYEINLFKKSYFRTSYVDKYYTLLCYYNDIGSLLGYMIISNRSDFHYQCYRSDIKLLENSVSEARNILEEELIVSQPILSENFDSDRLDNSRYYYECKMQHSFGALETCYVGFGFTDIGYLTDKIEPNMDPENVKINFITVFNDYIFNLSEGEDGYSMIDFINEYVIDDDVYAGISKGILTNLSEDVDFNDKIKEYSEEYKQ